MTVTLDDPSLFREQAYIAGAWIDADEGGRMEIDDPATGATIGTVPLMGAAETRRAIAAADATFALWRAKTAAERGAVLLRWRDLMMAAQEDLARLMTWEMGKPLAESRGEVGYAASFLEWFAEEAKRIYGDITPPHQASARILTFKQPVGVCAAITPWNFPAAMIARKVAPALAVGCPIVVKPAPATPFSALAMAVLAERAGLPAGLFSVVTGDAAAIGGEMCANATVRKLSFTGSTAVGRLLMGQCANTVKRLSLELGGNAPFIVFDDSDLDAAADGAIASKFRNAGQTCVCANRIYVQDGVYDAFAAKLAERAAKLHVGSGFEEGVAIGPLINDAALEKVAAHLADATAQGAQQLPGGGPDPQGGRFFRPTVLTGVTQAMAVAREETFGPLAPLFRFQTEDEAVAYANATEFGLAAYVYTRDAGRMFRVSEALDYGMVGMNMGVISTVVAPFGGMKQSGLGREGSRYGADEYLEIKYVCIGGI